MNQSNYVAPLLKMCFPPKYMLDSVDIRTLLYLYFCIETVRFIMNIFFFAFLH